MREYHQFAACGRSEEKYDGDLIPELSAEDVLCSAWFYATALTGDGPFTLHFCSAECVSGFNWERHLNLPED